MKVYVEGLYQAGISESGSTLTTWAVAQDARQLAFHIGEANLIFTGNSRILVDHLKNIRAARLLATANAAQLVSVFDYFISNYDLR